MEITRDIRSKFSAQISPVQEYLYSSPNAGGRQRKIANKYELKLTAKYKKFATTVGDIILGFYKIEDTVPLLQQELELDAKTAALLGADVLDFLAPLSDPNWQPPIDEMTDTNESSETELLTDELSITLAPSTTVTATESVDTHLPKPSIPNFVIPAKLVARVAPVTTPAGLPEIHTMASDATLARSPQRTSFSPSADSGEVVHPSTQPTTRQSLSDLPAYNSGVPVNIPAASPIVPEAPRWGS